MSRQFGDTDPLGRLLLRAERDANKQGWDQPHQAMAIHHHGGRLLAVTLTCDSVNALETVLMRLCTSRAMDPRTLTALGFLSEAWAYGTVGDTENRGSSLADAKAFMATYQYGDLETHPDRSEVRTISAYDGRNHYLVMRQRGQAPRTLLNSRQEIGTAAQRIGTEFRVITIFERCWRRLGRIEL